MIFAINFADKNYSMAQKLNSWSAKNVGKVDRVIEYSPTSIDFDFFEKNHEILAKPRGGGYWLWKPYIIKKTLFEIKENDFLVYCDSGAMYVKSILPLIAQMEKENTNIYCCATPFFEENWCKQSVLNDFLNKYDHSDIDFQIEATFMILKNTFQTHELIDSWLSMCCIPTNILDDEEYFKPCIEHRHDQALFSLVCKTQGILPHIGVSDRYLYHRIISAKDKYYRQSDVISTKSIALEYNNRFRNNGAPLYLIVHHLKNQNNFRFKVLKYYFKSVLAWIKGELYFHRDKRKRCENEYYNI